MLPLLFLALAVASDRTNGRKTAFREAPLSTWCRCQGETYSSGKENFGGLLSGLDFLFASEGEKKFRLEMAQPKICGLIPKRVQVDVRIGDLFESTAGLEKADLMLLDIWPKYGDVTEDLVRVQGAGTEMTVRV